MFADMPASSVTPAERSRKMVSVVFQALQEPGRQASIAVAMGASESTVSRIKNEQIENLTLLLAHAGLKIVPVDYVCVDRQTYESVAHLATRAMSRPEIAKQLIWEDE